MFQIKYYQRIFTEIIRIEKIKTFNKLNMKTFIFNHYYCFIIFRHFLKKKCLLVK